MNEHITPTTQTLQPGELIWLSVFHQNKLLPGIVVAANNDSYAILWSSGVETIFSMIGFEKRNYTYESAKSQLRNYQDLVS